MDHLSRIGVFVEVARQGGFAAAARALGLTSSAVSKQVQNLEHELRVKLLNRTTRQVALTEEGALFFERAQRALADLREATAQVHELRETPRGPLRISVPSSFGTAHLAGPIAAFARTWPDVHLDVHFDDRMVDIAAESFDLAIRIGALKDSTMTARKLSDCPFVVCAAPDYWAAQGVPRGPVDLARGNVLAYTRQGAHEWRYRAADGTVGMVGLAGTLRSDTAEMMIAAACAGLGAIIVPRIFVGSYLADGRLVAVLEDYTTMPERAIWAVFPPNRYMSTRLRLFVDHIGRTCTGMLHSV